ncbi:hypothetical protein BC831DRAFT_452499 [Entophlyctis helioformis]|nr:hypothetical protein BC831DRAFT_452499 [Entophlyctis helioformis]
MRTANTRRTCFAVVEALITAGMPNNVTVMVMPKAESVSSLSGAADTEIRGVLYKRTSGAIRRWAPRVFRLTRDTFAYYHSDPGDNSGSSSSSSSSQSASWSVSCQDIQSVHKLGDLAFEVRMKNDEVFELRAKTEEEVKQWTHGLESRLQSHWSKKLNQCLGSSRSNASLAGSHNDLVLKKAGSTALGSSRSLDNLKSNASGVSAPGSISNLSRKPSVARSLHQANPGSAATPMSPSATSPSPSARPSGNTNILSSLGDLAATARLKADAANAAAAAGIERSNRMSGIGLVSNRMVVSANGAVDGFGGLKTSASSASGFQFDGNSEDARSVQPQAAPQPTAYAAPVPRRQPSADYVNDRPETIFFSNNAASTIYFGSTGLEGRHAIPVEAAVPPVPAIPPARVSGASTTAPATDGSAARPSNAAPASDTATLSSTHRSRTGQTSLGQARSTEVLNGGSGSRLQEILRQNRAAQVVQLKAPLTPSSPSGSASAIASPSQPADATGSAQSLGFARESEGMRSVKSNEQLATGTIVNTGKRRSIQLLTQLGPRSPMPIDSAASTASKDYRLPSPLPLSLNRPPPPDLQALESQDTPTAGTPLKNRNLNDIFITFLTQLLQLRTESLRSNINGILSLVDVLLKESVEISSRMNDAVLAKMSDAQSQLNASDMDSFAFASTFQVAMQHLGMSSKAYLLQLIGENSSGASFPASRSFNSFADPPDSATPNPMQMQKLQQESLGKARQAFHEAIDSAAEKVETIMSFFGE